jgi:branched-chain amino acid transport system ATP-binding protein
VSYGGVRAVVDLHLKVPRGGLVGLIGANGAGKTTVIDALTGFASASGQARLDGREVLGLPAYQRARLGMARTWQSVDLFDDLTVRANLEVAATADLRLGRQLAGIIRSRARERDFLSSVLEDLGLDGISEHMPGDLSQGQRKLVGLARALACRPVLLLADEPAAGLDTQESTELGRRLRSTVDRGVTVLLIDHDMSLVLSICDYLYVLDHGALIAEGTVEEIRDDERVAAAYLGTSVTANGSGEGP